ncbi:MAG TPA: DUF4384 domain-containing protein [Pyrinomonadaceae bacterium]|jgi:hypothetical protein
MRAVFNFARPARTLGLMLGAALCLSAAGPAAAQNRWDDKVVIKRPESKPGRKPALRQPARRAPSTQRAALLTLQWRVLRFTDEGLRKVVGVSDDLSINDTFSPRDRLVIALKPNQSGYLYVIRQPSSGGDGQLLFPTRNYNGGKNYVVKDQEYVLPSDCSDFSVPCWLNFPPKPGKETLTLVFSRDQIDELPNSAPPAGRTQTVGAARLAALAAASEQKLTRVRGLSIDGIWVRNTNAANNEEIIETLTLNNAGAARPGGAASGN